MARRQCLSSESCVCRVVRVRCRKEGTNTCIIICGILYKIYMRMFNNFVPCVSRINEIGFCIHGVGVCV